MIEARALSLPQESQGLDRSSINVFES
jgi:hypothetical protein